jgi:molecular chaperone DnaK
MTRLIEKNTTIPARKSEVFSTAQDNQPAVSVHVLQGEREMAGDNKTLGRFELTDIAPAPRGTPQIEVTFDIDANGIVEVSAKDQATGKQQSIRITASSGLSKEEIDRLVRDAEMHADGDRRRRELIDARNAADALVYNTEKALAEAGAAVDGNLRMEIDSAVANLKSAMAGEDSQAIQRATEVLTAAVQKLHTAGFPGADPPPFRFFRTGRRCGGRRFPGSGLMRRHGQERHHAFGGERSLPPCFWKTVCNNPDRLQGKSGTRVYGSP